MSYVWKYLSQFFVKFLPKILRFGSIGIAGLFVVSTFIVEIFTKGFVPALDNLLRSVFASELVINSNVTLAIQNSPEYNLHAFLSIIMGVLIIYSVIKWSGVGFKKIFNANEGLAQWISGFIIFIFISLLAILLIEGQLGFRPLVDSIGYLIYNINPVINNIF